ncbi:Mur ligase domain-containing protein [Kitasatospora sp. NPDC051984]|uniref:Mur ligase domain-containing protein n=1 Tax=Kitasatospora sp. NPDC051984 TaxID=3364059 RepID=UPI0037C66E21
MDTTAPRTAEEPGAQRSAALPVLLTAPHLVDITEDGMRGLAQWLAGAGASVSGSVLPALADSPAVAALRGAGVQVDVGFDAGHVSSDRTAVVWSAAVMPAHPELEEAYQRKLPVLRRADALAEIAALAGERTVAVWGSHSTATAAAALAAAMDDGTTGWVLTAAVRNRAAGSFGTEQGMLVVDFGPDAGTHEAPVVAGWQYRPRSHFVRERPKPSYALILTTDKNVPHIADNVAGLDAAEVLAVSAATVVLPTWEDGAINLRERLADRVERGLPAPRVVTVGVDGKADVQVEQLLCDDDTTYRATIRFGGQLHTFTVPAVGPQRAYDVCAAIATALVVGEKAAAVAERLRDFRGSERSLAVLGQEAGVCVAVSGARHPREVAADVTTARNLTEGKIIAVLEPDGLARTWAHGADLGSAVASADRVLLLPVHTPLSPVLDTEYPLDTVQQVLLQRLGPDAVHRLRTGPDAPSAAQQVAELSGPGDLVLLIGTGKTASLGKQLLARLAANPDTQNADQP